MLTLSIKDFKKLFFKNPFYSLMGFEFRKLKYFSWRSALRSETIFDRKLFSFLRYLHFFSDFLVMYSNALIRKLCLKFMTSQTVLQIIIIRSSRPEVLCKIGVLRNFAKFKEKHLCRGLCFKNVAGLSPATLLKMIV